MKAAQCFCPRSQLKIKQATDRQFVGKKAGTKGR